MFFRSSLVFFLFTSALVAAERTFPFGVIIRPAFVKNLVTTLNKRYNAEKALRPFSFCYKEKDLTLSGTLKVSIAPPEWAAAPLGQIFLSTTVSDFTFQGQIAPGCGDLLNEEEAFRLKVEISSIPLELSIHAQTLTAFVQRDLAYPLADATEIFPKDEKPKDGSFYELINERDTQVSLFMFLLESVEQHLSDWIRKRLRDFVFVQSLDELIGDRGVWNQGGQIERGAVLVENAGGSLSERLITFAFFPFEQPSVFVNSEGAEIYLNSMFLNRKSLMEIVPRSLDNLSDAELLESVKQRLSYGIDLNGTTFRRPLLPQSQGDFAIIFSSQLSDQALETVYLEQLLHFRAMIPLGVHTEGILVDASPELSTIIQMSPHSAPKIAFSANKLKLELRNYGLDIGTWLEDRLIPSHRLSATVAMNAGLEIDTSDDTVNLVVDSDSFSIKLDDEMGHLNSDVLSIIENITNDLWISYFNDYPKLVLFPTIINTDKAPLIITDVRPDNEMIVIDLNVDWENVKL